jgi:hypothetical protein
MFSVDSVQAQRSSLFFKGSVYVQLSYGELERLLSELHRIAPSRRTALQGRIKHFQRNGWPGGTNTGKGRAAIYDFGAVLKLALGFELLQLGVTPERSSDLLRENWQLVRTATSLAIEAHQHLRKHAGTDEPFEVYLYCDPQALAGLSDPADDATEDTFFYTSALEMARHLQNYRGIETRRLALINLSQLIDGIIAFTENSGDFRESWEPGKLIKPHQIERHTRWSLALTPMITRPRSS